MVYFRKTAEAPKFEMEAEVSPGLWAGTISPVVQGEKRFVQRKGVSVDV